MTATEARPTTYHVEGRMIEVCSCNAICPCWVGEDPDNGVCESVFAWKVDRGTVEGVDVGDRTVAASVHIPGNVLAGNWTAVLYVDDRCTPEQERELVKVFTGDLGGGIADLAALIGEVVAIERAPITYDVDHGEGTFGIGEVARAEFNPFHGATGRSTVLQDSVFASIPGSPAYAGKAATFRRSGGHGLPDIEVSGKNAIQTAFRFEA